MTAVLIVEPQAVTRKLLRELVRAGGHQPIAVPDLERARERIRRHRHELVAVVANTWGIDGGDVLDLVWPEPAGPEPAVLLYRAPAPALDEIGLAGGSRCGDAPAIPAHLALRLSDAMRLAHAPPDPAAAPPSPAVTPRSVADPVPAVIHGLQLELDRKTAEIERMQAERTKLVMGLVSAQERERERVAADIHDDSLQAMAAAVLRLGTLAREMPDAAQRESVSGVALAVEAAISRVRRLVFELTPPDLEESSLGDALRLYVREFASDARFRWTVRDRLVEQPPADTKTVLFRVAQEALRNVRKHADARQVEVTLSHLDRGILLQVRDDGLGLAPGEIWRLRPGHIGVRSMRERVERAGGRLDIRGAPGAGAIVEAWLPGSGAYPIAARWGARGPSRSAGEPEASPRTGVAVAATAVPLVAHRGGRGR